MTASGGRGRSGLTLGELILALALLGLVISTLLLLFLALMSSSTKGTHLSTGVLEAERVLEALAIRAEQGGASLPATLTGMDSFYAQDALRPTTFAYEVTSTQLESNPMGKAYWLQVTVRWWSLQTSETRQGSGQLFVNRGRMVYLPR